jgi:hypothetical protein
MLRKVWRVRTVKDIEMDVDASEQQRRSSMAWQTQSVSKRDDWNGIKCNNKYGA